MKSQVLEDAGDSTTFAKLDILRGIMLSMIGAAEFDLFVKMLKRQWVNEEPLNEKVAIAELKKANANK